MAVTRITWWEASLDPRDVPTCKAYCVERTCRPVAIAAYQAISMDGVHEVTQVSVRSLGETFVSIPTMKQLLHQYLGNHSHPGRTDFKQSVLWADPDKELSSGFNIGRNEF